MVADRIIVVARVPQRLQLLSVIAAVVTVVVGVGGAVWLKTLPVLMCVGVSVCSFDPHATNHFLKINLSFQQEK